MDIGPIISINQSIRKRLNSRATSRLNRDEEKHKNKNVESSSMLILRNVYVVGVNKSDKGSERSSPMQSSYRVMCHLQSASADIWIIRAGPV